MPTGPALGLLASSFSSVGPPPFTPPPFHTPALKVGMVVAVLVVEVFYSTERRRWRRMRDC